MPLKIGKSRKRFKLVDITYLDENNKIEDGILITPIGKNVFQLNDKIPFGKYATSGLTFEQIFFKDPGYINYLFRLESTDSNVSKLFIASSEEMTKRAFIVCTKFGVTMHPYYHQMLEKNKSLGASVPSSVTESTIQSFKIQLERL